MLFSESWSASNLCQLKGSFKYLLYQSYPRFLPSGTGGPGTVRFVFVFFFLFSCKAFLRPFGMTRGGGLYASGTTFMSDLLNFVGSPAPFPGGPPFLRFFIAIAASKFTRDLVSSHGLLGPGQLGVGAGGGGAGGPEKKF